jgi:tripartite-type tricarboxylate transporter receptor subunit TctC
MVVPAATPPAAISRLNSELVRALGVPAVKEKLKTYGMDTVPGSPQAFDAFLRAEYERYGAVVREAGIKAE